MNLGRGLFITATGNRPSDPGHTTSATDRPKHRVREDAVCKYDEHT